MNNWIRLGKSLLFLFLSLVYLWFAVLFLFSIIVTILGLLGYSSQFSPDIAKNGVLFGHIVFTTAFALTSIFFGLITYALYLLLDYLKRIWSHLSTISIRV